jgi:hypothetical protein
VAGRESTAREKWQPEAVSPVAGWEPGQEREPALQEREPREREPREREPRERALPGRGPRERALPGRGPRERALPGRGPERGRALPEPELPGRGPPEPRPNLGSPSGWTARTRRPEKA